MSDSTVFKAGQSLRRREMMKAAVVGAAGLTAGTASSGTAAATDDDDGEFMDQLPDPSPRHAITGPLEVTYAIVSGFRNPGIAEEDVDEMTAENYHTRVWQTFQTNHNSIEGTFDQLENFIHAGDPTASPLAEMAYSTLRTTALQALQDGKSVTEARTEGENAAMEDLSVSAINVLNQFNDYVADVIQFFGPYAEGGLAQSLAEVDLSSGDDVYVTDGVVEIEPQPDGLPSTADWIPDTSGNPVTGIELTTKEWTLPNGDSHPYYRVYFDVSSSADGTYSFDEREQHSTTGNRYEFDIVSPDGDSIEFLPGNLAFEHLLDAIEDIRSDIASEAGDAIEEIMNAHNAGDVDDMDVLSSFDLMREFGDSGDMTRYTAELLAAGLDAQEDVSQNVTIDHPDTGERTGRLFLSWNWDELADWEYDYDDDDLVLEVAEESIDDVPELIAAFEDDEVTIDAADLTDGTYQFEEDHGDLEAVERESQGQLWSHIPVGTETDHWDAAYMIHDTGDGGNLENLDPDEPFELVAVEDDGEELDVLQLDGWNNQTRDPALALDEAARTQEHYKTSDDLEPSHGGGGGGDSNTLLIGGMVLALVGMILAALMGDS